MINPTIAISPIPIPGALFNPFGLRLPLPRLLLPSAPRGFDPGGGI